MKTPEVKLKQFPPTCSITSHFTGDPVEVADGTVIWFCPGGHLRAPFWAHRFAPKGTRVLTTFTLGVPVMLTDPVTAFAAGKFPTLTVPCTGNGVLITVTSF